MGASLLSNRQPAEHVAQEKSSRAMLAVHTMRDDLENTEDGEKKPPQQGQVAKQKSADDRGRAVSSQPSINPFSEEGEKLFESQKKGASHQSGNPFGVVPERINKPESLPSDFSQQPALENGLRPLIQRGVLLTNRPIIGKKLLMSSVGAAVILLILAGIWAFFFDSGGKVFDPDLSSGVIEETPGIPESVAPEQYPFSLDKPNYLSIDTETASSQDIKKSLSQAADRIKEAGITEPVEFLMTDQNNNPLAFSRFAFLLQLELDSDLLALVDEPFSLYEYDDAGSVRLGLALTLTDAPAATAIIQKIEPQLPYAFRALILEPNISVGKKLSFRSTNYNQFAVRFTNIDSNQNLSLDYASNSDQLFIGMSKNTLRVILDANAK